jgi:hypothetical protein
MCDLLWAAAAGVRVDGLNGAANITAHGDCSVHIDSAQGPTVVESRSGDIELTFETPRLPVAVNLHGSAECRVTSGEGAAFDPRSGDADGAARAVEDVHQWHGTLTRAAEEQGRVSSGRGKISDAGRNTPLTSDVPGDVTAYGRRVHASVLSWLDRIRRRMR